MKLKGKVRKVGHYAKTINCLLLSAIVIIASAGYARAYIRDNDGDFNKLLLMHDAEHASMTKYYSQYGNYSQTEPGHKTYTVEDGDSFFEILRKNGISAEDAMSIIKKTRRVFNTSKIKPGNSISFHFLPRDQNISQIDYEISDLKQLVIKVSEERISARIVERDRQERFISSCDAVPSIPVQSLKKDTPGDNRVQHIHQAPRERQSATSQGERQVDIRIRKGQSLSNILNSAGVSRIDIDRLTRSVRGVYNLSSLKSGNTLSVWLEHDRGASISRLAYEINDTKYLDVRNVHGSFKAQVKTLSKEVRYDSAQGRIRSSLYGSAVSDGVSPEVIVKLSDIFAHDINFFSGVQTGDTYAVLYEKYYVKDRFKGYGRVVAARFINQGEKHTAIYYENKRRGIQGYYDEKGRPMKKMFLKAPLNYRRISSFFSHHRLHPIFGVVRPHLGVDYAAPMGTPVCSLGPGKVVFRGWIRGYGQTVRIKHPDGYVTYYGHLSKFAKGMRPGKRVDQGDTIGYVGRTGYATGPHLDFRVSRYNKFINPLKMKNVNGPPLRGSVLADFKHICSVRLAMLENKSDSIAMDHPEPKKEAPGG